VHVYQDDTKYNDIALKQIYASLQTVNILCKY